MLKFYWGLNIRLNKRFSPLLFKIFYLLYIFGCSGPSFCTQTFLVVASGQYSLVAVHVVLVESSCCGALTRTHRLQQSWCMGLVSLWPVESSWTRVWTHVRCIISRQILNLWTTREVLVLCFLLIIVFFLLYYSILLAFIIIMIVTFWQDKL